jgi:hypothetical protein
VRSDSNSSEVFASPDSVGGDFGLILEAFADAFRSLAPASRPACNCPTLHFAGWR